MQNYFPFHFIHFILDFNDISILFSLQKSNYVIYKHYNIVNINQYYLGCKGVMNVWFVLERKSGDFVLAFA